MLLPRINDILNNIFLCSSISETYEYDYLGNRTSKTSSGVTTEYTTDLSSGYSQVLKATEGNNNVYYTRGFELISRREATTASFYVYDGSLSVRALTNEVGTVTDTLVFDAFGNETGRTGTTDNPYGFQGEEQDATGLYYLRARYMDPATGTFTTMDTYGGSLSDTMSLHKYLFANSNPVMYSDPSGHASMIETGATICIMSILSGSANAIIAEFIYKNNTDISERSTKDLDKLALTAFLTGFTTCLFSCLTTFFVFGFCINCSRMHGSNIYMWLYSLFFDEAANYARNNGSEVAATGLEIVKQAATSAEIGFYLSGINGGGQSYDQNPKNRMNNTESSTANPEPWYKPDSSKNFPPNNGAVPESGELVNIPEGTIIVRYGKVCDDSVFVTASGFNIDELSIPPWTLESGMRTEYMVSQPISALRSIAAPWRGASGGGT